jgi:hypothetical protein
VTTEVEKPNVAEILDELKPFQRKTAEHAFHCLYDAPGGSRRFLVADEVGLGKTFVARGIIAKVVERLWDEVDRIDVVYICSNLSIARQNVASLTIGKHVAFPTRLTLLPARVRDLQRSKLNFVSLTPGTSFNQGTCLGEAQERALLYAMLKKAWGLSGLGPKKLLQGNVKELGTFEWHISRVTHIDPSLQASFERALQRHVRDEQTKGHDNIRIRFEALARRFSNRIHLPYDIRCKRNEVIGELRGILAGACVTALEPDLVILDEFQRFKHLLVDDNPAGVLAQTLFGYSDETTAARVLLLSATPYKMYTLHQEQSESDDDHYRDFLDTARFLLNDLDRYASVKSLLEQFRREVYHLEQGTEALARVKTGLETSLRTIMARTERLAVSGDRNGMLTEIPNAARALGTAEVRSYTAVQRISTLVDSYDLTEFWKSSPYLLNLMDSYQFKTAFREALALPERNRELASLLSRAPESLLDWDALSRYCQVDPNNFRLAQLMADAIDGGLWRLLWMPPALPYYECGEPFPGDSTCTKRLVFSSWGVVPKAIAVLLSYEVERLVFQSFEQEPENSGEARRRRGPLLNFSRRDGRLRGMPVLALIYPSPFLAVLGDPSTLLGYGKRTATQVVDEVKERLSPDLARVTSTFATRDSIDEAWYWAAPILLDRERYGNLVVDWFADDNLALQWSIPRTSSAEDDVDGSESHQVGWENHIAEVRSLLRGEFQLGSPPKKLALVIAQMAVAGLGVVGLRAICRGCGADSMLHSEAMSAAGRIGWAFRSLLNMPEAMALIRGTDSREPYWRRALEYAVAGNVQAMLDEYAHMLVTPAVQRYPLVERWDYVSGQICEALMLRTTTMAVDRVEVRGDTVRIDKERPFMRGHFAQRFGRDRLEGLEESARTDALRRAFNSPFWPFVLASTSVGQEGLDFHWYCHAVVHWNLPGNPVDMEQREGRVHRYKGHAVRKNLASQYASQIGPLSNSADPWAEMFARGDHDLSAASAGLIPYWILDGDAKIERHVPMLPLSRETQLLPRLKRSLAVYRMVFGQARQEDLLQFLVARFSETEIEQVKALLQIDLSPPETVMPDIPQRL